METPKKYLESGIDDYRELYFNKLCKETGLTLIQSELKDLCECSTDNIFLKTKQEVKAAIYTCKKVILYLNITDEQAKEEVYISSDNEINRAKTFAIIGWSDYEYVKVRTNLNLLKRHRGYFMVVPTDEVIEPNNIHYIPYAHFDICDDKPFVREVWAIRNLEEDIREKERSGFKLRIGDNCIVCDGVEHCIDACAYYHTWGNPLVPIRQVAERIGYTVKWSRFKHVIELISNDNHIHINTKKNICTVNGEVVELSVPVSINKYTKRAYANLGFIRHVLGLDAKFDKATETVHIFTD